MSALEQKEEEIHSPPFIIVPQESSGGKKQTFPSQVASFLWEEVVGKAQIFEKWVALVRMRSGRFKPSSSSGFPHRLLKPETVPHRSLIEENSRAIEVISGESYTVADNNIHLDQAPETSLWARLETAATLNIESNSITWSCLSSLHHTEHTSGDEKSEDELNKALEVTVNSGGVVFFALFNNPDESVILPKEAAAVIKITSSRLATLSERLGYEFAKWLGVQTPQARVVHNFNVEWQNIKSATETACKNAVLAGDELGEMTCSELLEALEMSRCILLMNYIHGSPLLKSMQAFDSLEASENTALALGRILVLDLVLRNEDRLPCHQLGWRGNPGNLLFVDKIVSKKLDALAEIVSLSFERNNSSAVRSFMKNQKTDHIIRRESLSKSSVELNEMGHTPTMKKLRNVNEHAEFHIVAIDIGVPRRPPAGKRVKDQEQYPRLVELILNSSDYSSNILHEISGGKLGFSASDEAKVVSPCSPTSYPLPYADMMTVVNKFRGGFRDALMDLQSFHLFLLTLHQKLDGLFRILESIISRNSDEHEKDEHRNSVSPHSADLGVSTPPCKEQLTIESPENSIESKTHRNTPRSSPRGESEQHDRQDSSSYGSRGNLSGKYFKGSGDQFHRLRLTMKLHDFQKFVKVDAEFNKEFEQWVEMLRIDVVNFCLENHFNTGFFDGNHNNIVIDAYELKVRLEHVLERIAIISDAMNTERPSRVMDNLFIGGALAARSVHTLQYLGITHILCFCLDEIGQLDSQHLELFEYKNFSISDTDEEDINSLFEEACDFIDTAAHSGGKVLVHCFEGKSRSATVVIAYLMLRKGHTLSESWNMLKKVHRRAQPNDGFAKTLLKLDARLHGKVSMDWQQKRPVMKMCLICGMTAGLSTNSLKLHMQKSHKRILSGSVDSLMTAEIQELKISGAGNNTI